MRRSLSEAGEGHYLTGNSSRVIVETDRPFSNPDTKAWQGVPQKLPHHTSERTLRTTEERVPSSTSFRTREDTEDVEERVTSSTASARERTLSTTVSSLQCTLFYKLLHHTTERTFRTTEQRVPSSTASALHQREDIEGNRRACTIFYKLPQHTRQRGHIRRITILASFRPFR
ncbi:hypothetical protein AVEN_163568-1 [Araneus ventricosus]|uniref:Uncharacterized protein n=2 Tax=Araneus ventricosus TaxID=182803 RepID=A0A4Y2VTR6_ARAVE|nr:hypothetical protein AVEN_163568-1 [Araneus ventricosus]